MICQNVQIVVYLDNSFAYFRMPNGLLLSIEKTVDAIREEGSRLAY
jgi:hypothetical protein